MKNIFIVLLLIFSMIQSTECQSTANYDEAAVPSYELPALLLSQDGEEVNSVDGWEQVRRSEIYEMLENEMFGKIPDADVTVQYELVDVDQEALGGKAIRKQIRMNCSNDNGDIEVLILAYLPKTDGPSPVFVGYNFFGNQSIHADPNILLTNSWVRNSEQMGINDNTASEASRGKRDHRWDLDAILGSGYGLVTIYYGDVDPDIDDFSDGIHKLFYRPGQTQPVLDEWGSIGAWSWGLSRVMDYLEKDTDVDREKVIVFGHSRLGKTSLWAGASDDRFALVISNNSGCGGAALSRRKFGETVERINRQFPHWFCDNYNQYSDNESNMPFDQHMLIALAAPRPIYVASAAEDLWADPKGEFLSCVEATSVYNLYGLNGIKDRAMPEVNSPIHSSIGYHIRTGIHDVTAYDWNQYIQFADLHLK